MAKGLSENDPLYQDILKIVHSPPGIKAAVRATNQGQPALCGVDPLLSAELGNAYTRENYVTMNAGYVVAGLMREMGYSEAGTGKCADGCVAESGMRWTPKVTI